MNLTYDEYLSAGTEKIMQIVSAKDMEEEEKTLIVSAFTDKLVYTAGDVSKLDDCEYIAYTASLEYMDSQLGKMCAAKGISYSDCNKALVYCDRIRETKQRFSQNGWKLPALNVSNLDACEAQFRNQASSLSLSSQVSGVDSKLTEHISVATTQLKVQACDDALELVNELEALVSKCKKSKTALPAIKNADYKKIRKQLTALRPTAVKKEAIHSSISEMSSKIDMVVAAEPTALSQWEEIVSLCDNVLSLLNQNSQNRWPSPKVNRSNLEDIRKQYSLYISMVQLDRTIDTTKGTLASNREFQNFFANCAQQKANLDTCNAKDWTIPELSNCDIKALEDSAKRKKAEVDRKKKVKRTLTGLAFAAAAILVIVISATIKSREGKIQTPFSYEYAVGKDKSDINDELRKAGFTNIQTESDKSGWMQSNSVIEVTIDNAGGYAKGKYVNPEVRVVIVYSSSDRICFTDAAKGWEKADAKTFSENLMDAGFNNITINEIDTFEKSKDGEIASLEVNGEVFTAEECYIPKDALIVINRYVFKICIGNSNAEFKGQDYKSVVESLNGNGFTNVQTEEIKTGWVKGDSVIGVTVNSNTSYKEDDVFSPDAKIVVKFSSNDRIDVTTTFNNYKNQDYQTLQRNLKSAGFTSIKIVEQATHTKAQHHKVAGITVGGQTYTGGDCYIPKNTTISITYYAWKIVVGSTSEDIVDKYDDDKAYQQLVEDLKAQGFTNITLLRGNNLTTGWVSKEGSIKSIIIGGKEDFSATDEFYSDVEIKIVVHTFKKKGCEDITKTE